MSSIDIEKANGNRLQDDALLIPWIEYPAGFPGGSVVELDSWQPHSPLLTCHLVASHLVSNKGCDDRALGQARESL